MNYIPFLSDITLSVFIFAHDSSLKSTVINQNKPCSSILLLVLWLASPTLTSAQNPTNKSPWPSQIQEVEIPSSEDATSQKAYFYRTHQAVPQPLLVSLHSWSSDYRQKDPLIWQLLPKDWNYIHPDFRGPNVRPCL